MFRLRLTVFLFFISHVLFSADISGIISDEVSGDPVTFAIIVLVETDMVSETDEEGRFLFSDAEPGGYTLLVMADGYPDSEHSITSGDENLIFLAGAMVEMEEIVIVEERFEEEAELSLDEEMMKDMSSGGDPFLLIDTKEDVALIQNKGENNAAVSAWNELDELFGIPVFRFKLLFNYHGLPYYANSFYYDSYIPLYYLSYSFFMVPSTDSFSASPVAMGIFPVGILSSMDMFGPGSSVRMGTGAGLTTSAVPHSLITGQSSLSLESSIMQLNALSQIRFNDKFGLSLSVRKSLMEYTWVPLLWTIMKEAARYYTAVSFPTFLQEHFFPGFTDTAIRLIFRPSGDHAVFTDLFIAAGYTDVHMEILSAGELSADYQIALINYMNIQAGTGIKWEWDPGDSFKNTLAVYNLYHLNSTTNNIQNIVERGIHSTSGYPLNEAGLRDDIDFTIFESTEFLSTLIGRFLYGDFLYHYRDDIDPLDIKEDDRRGTPIYEWEISGYLGIRQFIGPFTLNPGVRIDYFSIIDSANPADQIRFSPVLNIELDTGEILGLRFSGGMSYDRFDYSEILPMRAAISVEPNEDDFLDRRRLLITDEFEKKVPARLFFGELDFTLIPAEWELSGGIYGHYMDDLSGVDLQSMQSQTVMLEFSSQEQISMVPTDRLYSYGAHGRFVRYFGDNFLTLGYNFGYSRYGEENKDSWIVPNNDVRHTAKSSLHVVLFKHWGIDFTLNCFLGIPVTPNKITYVYDSETFRSLEWEPVNDQYNGFYDYMPHFTWSLKTDFRWNPFGGEARIFIDLANLFPFPNRKI